VAALWFRRTSQLCMSDLIQGRLALLTMSSQLRHRLFSPTTGSESILVMTCMETTTTSGRKRATDPVDKGTIVEASLPLGPRDKGVSWVKQ